MTAPLQLPEPPARRSLGRRLEARALFALLVLLGIVLALGVAAAAGTVGLLLFETLYR